MNKTLIILIVSLLTVIFVMIGIYCKKKKNDLDKQFLLLNFSLIIDLMGLIIQIVFRNTSIHPVYFDYITYTGGMFIPVIFMNISLLYNNSSLFKSKLKYLFIIPAINLISLFTNDIHHLFYKVYSVNMTETVVGPLFYVYSIYSYTLIFSAIVVLIITSMKKSGFFSIQTALIILGGLAPLIINILGTLKIISMTIYVTPIMFIFTSICYSIAIFRYKALNIVPIAFRTIIDTMSDAYVVISNDGTIVDSNKTFRNKFNDILKITKDDNLFSIVDSNKVISLSELKDDIKLTRKNGIIISKEYHISNDEFNHYFEVDIHPISSVENTSDYIGTLLLFKDITQHKQDIKELNEKQDVIVKQQQLVSIGELAGGVAHDINTPISAIKTGILMLEEMTGTRTDSEKEILMRMDNCATKIINIVNSMRNQIRNLGGDTNIDFKISSVVNDIRIITYHELAKNKTTIDISIVDDLSVKGDPTKLGQVLTNLVVNGSQAYGETGGKIEIIVKEADENTAMITIKDYAGGLDEKIKPYIFKNILTTKGTYGTGLGLYLAYSVIKGNFNGDITFESETGVGTTFMIKIPKAGSSIEEISKEQDTPEH